MEHTKPLSKLITIFGPTSSGKTDLSLKITRYIYGKYHIESELISSDSRQIYIDMDIGTSKVSTDTRQKYPHHMIDIFPPTARCRSDQLISDANKIINDVLKKGRVPILVGGTGTFVMGIVGDRYLKKASEDRLPYATLLLVPYFERSTLYRKIESNVGKMFKMGLYSEVKDLINKYQTIPIQIKKTHGYREFVEYSSTNRISLFKLTPSDLEIIKGKIKAHTKKYAMHQISWLEKMRGYHTVKDFEEAKPLIDRFMSNL